ncbi:peptidase M23 [Streptomyces olivoreticuli]
MAGLNSLFLTAATLKVFEPPASGNSSHGALIEKCELQFNPNELSMVKSADIRRSPSRAAPSATPAEFSGANPRTLSFNVFLDQTNPLHSGTIEKTVKRLLSCCSPTQGSIDSKQPSLPWVRLEWGSAGLCTFNALMTNVQVTYKLFGLSGDPLRATCSLSMEEVGGVVARQNPSSGTLSVRKEWLLIEGDSLPLIAWRDHGQPADWRKIAECNGIDDPDHLMPGRTIMLPSSER